MAHLHHTRTTPRINPTDAHKIEHIPSVHSKTQPATHSPTQQATHSSKTQIYIMLSIFVAQASLDLFAFAWVGLVLKWPLVYGDKSHAHAHQPEEFYIWGPNNYLNIGMTAFAVDLFEPVFLSIFYCVRYCKQRRNKPHKSVCFYNFFRYLGLIYSGLCVLLIGGALAMCIPLSLSQHPPIVIQPPPPSPPVFPEGMSRPPGAPLPFPPPAAPAPHEEIFEDSSLVLYYVLSIVIAILKIFSYVFGYAHSIYQVKYIKVY